MYTLERFGRRLHKVTIVPSHEERGARVTVRRYDHHFLVIKTKGHPPHIQFSGMVGLKMNFCKVHGLQYPPTQDLCGGEARV